MDRLVDPAARLDRDDRTVETEPGVALDEGVVGCVDRQVGPDRGRGGGDRGRQRGEGEARGRGQIGVGRVDGAVDDHDAGAAELGDPSEEIGRDLGGGIDASEGQPGEIGVGRVAPGFVAAGRELGRRRGGGAVHDGAPESSASSRSWFTKSA